MNQKKKPTNTSANSKPTKKKEKRKRFAFRPSFKERGEYFFSKLLEDFDHISDQRKQPTFEFGFLFISCYRNLSHSIEMISKDILFRSSKYLIFHDFERMDLLDPNAATGKSITCTAKVALARAHKFMDASISQADCFRLVDTITKRHDCEHNLFTIRNFENSLTELVRNTEILSNIYNKYYRNGDIFKRTEEISGEDIVVRFKKLQRETSDSFKALEQKIVKLKRKQIQIIQCMSCNYLFAEVDHTLKKYNCHYCSDVGHLVKCHELSCSTEVWASSAKSEQRCSTHKFIWHYSSSDSILGAFRNELAHYIGNNITEEQLNEFTELKVVENELKTNSVWKINKPSNEEK